MLSISKGSKRLSILVFHKYCLKIPRPHSWHAFIKGIDDNLNEKIFYSTNFDRLAPIYFSLLGFINVMPYVKVMNDQETLEIWKDVVDSLEERNVRIMYKNIVEEKTDSVGWLNGKVVAVDYAR